MAPGFSIASSSKRTESFDDYLQKHNQYLAAMVMSIVVMVFVLILIIDCCCKKKMCFGTDKKIGAEGTIGKKSNEDQNNFDLPPAYSTLSQK